MCKKGKPNKTSIIKYFSGVGLTLMSFRETVSCYFWIVCFAQIKSNQIQSHVYATITD